MKEEIITVDAPGAIGPYSQAIRCGNMVFVSGCLPLCPKTAKIEREIKLATKQMLENMKSVLIASGLSFDNVVKTTVFMSDLEMFTDMNEIYAEYFKKPYPARSCVQVARLPKDVLVEAECIAILK